MPARKKNHKKKYVYGRSLLSYLSYGVYFLLITLFIAYHLYYSDKIISNVTVNGRDFGGLTVQESIAKIRTEFPKTGTIKVRIEDSYEKEVGFDDIDFKYSAIETTSRAFDVGRESNFFEALKNKFVAIFDSVNLEPSYDYDKSKLEAVLNNIKRESGLVAEETHFELVDGEVKIIEGKIGKSFDQASLENKVIEGFVLENFAPVSESLYEIKPEFSVGDLSLVMDQLTNYLEVGFILKYNENEWPITKEELISMFDVEKDTSGKINLQLNDLRIAEKLSAIAAELDRNPRGQVLEVEGGKAVKFVSSEDGYHLKIKESTSAVRGGILAQTKEIQLSVQVASAPEAENEFGIEQLLAVGTSTFKGSIPGRVFNIGLASSRVSGTLVPPGENFSFVESVGEISRATGYTSAYVISGGRTILGDGGGVCQVSTTMFRAALNAGLPIIERNPHSYRVGYYEQDSPPGIDAAIYSPSVDLKFKNDTPGYILITTEFNEADSTLAFKIYGKSDGRTVEISEPKVLSRTPPPATVYEDDPTLPKGQTKRVEGAVWGASVVFGRVVKRDGEILSEDTFKSNYRAWAAVYKVGTKE